MLSIRQQCQLLGINRSSWYYEPMEIRPEDIILMNELDRQYMKTPFYGILRMTEAMERLGYHVNHKHIARLMHVMGIEAIYPKPNTSIPNAGHTIYPYLLRNLTIQYPDHVWSSDLTYLPTARGYAYCVGIMDWYSRFMLSWTVSNTQDVNVFLSALEAALRYAIPDIFNSDQGSQFTSIEFTSRLLSLPTRISMDGRGRALDNVFIERVWRSLKYENVYLMDYPDIASLRAGVDDYFRFYNYERPHQSLQNQTPAEVYGKFHQLPEVQHSTFSEINYR